MQEIAHHFGGVVSPSTEREFGRASVQITKDSANVELSSDIGTNIHSINYFSLGTHPSIG